MVDLALLAVKVANEIIACFLLEELFFCMGKIISREKEKAKPPFHL